MNSYLQKITGRWSVPDDTGNQSASVILPVVPLVYNAGEHDLVEEQMMLPPEPVPASSVPPRLPVQQPVHQQKQTGIIRTTTKDTSDVPLLKPLMPQLLPGTTSPVPEPKQQSVAITQLLAERNRTETINAYTTKIIAPSTRLTMIHNSTGKKEQLTAVEPVHRPVQEMRSPVPGNITTPAVKNLVKPILPAATDGWNNTIVTAGPANNKKPEPTLSIGKVIIEIIRPAPLVKTREPQPKPVNRAESSPPLITNHKLSFGLKQL